ncbi:hypothetical protein SATRM34S_06990 [Streptomyces atroolivaceus]
MSALRPPGGLRQRLVHRVHGQVVAGKGRAGLLRQIRQPPARWVVTPKRLRPGRPRSSHHRQAAHTSSHACQWAAVRSARNIDDRGSHGVSVVGRPAVEAGARGAAGPGGFKGSVVLREGGRARAVQDSGVRAGSGRAGAVRRAWLGAGMLGSRRCHAAGGRVQQALDRGRPDDTGLASEHACRYVAELLVRAGQVDEAIAVLTRIWAGDGCCPFCRADRGTEPGRASPRTARTEGRAGPQRLRCGAMEP